MTLENDNKCAICGQVFDNWKNYRYHTLEEHRPELATVGRANSQVRCWLEDRQAKLAYGRATYGVIKNAVGELGYDYSMSTTTCQTCGHNKTGQKFYEACDCQCHKNERTNVDRGSLEQNAK